MSISDKKLKIQEILEKYRKAGKISKDVKDLIRKDCKPGVNAYELCQKVEALMHKKGAQPAFPTNFSINNEAAHYSPEILDTRILPENSIVKIDLGCHIDGYIVDTAITLNFNPELDNLTQSSLTALEKAIEVAGPGVKVSKLGVIIEKSIVADGFEPVRNLSGHQIKRYVLHAGVGIPNCGPGYFDRVKHKLEAGRIYAIEPFASTGKGWIKNGRTTNIFRFVNKPKKKEAQLMSLYKEYKEKVGVLPFSPRMLFDETTGVEGKNKINENLKKMKRRGIIMGYPVLIEEDPLAMISQHEHTIRITNTGTELLT